MRSTIGRTSISDELTRVYDCIVLSVQYGTRFRGWFFAHGWRLLAVDDILIPSVDLPFLCLIL